MPNGAHSFVKAEALKVSYRQTREGMVIAFAIKPEDMPPELALAPVGTRVLLAVAELRDDAPEPEPVSETPKPKDDQRSERAREAYRMKDEMEKAATRSAMLPKDPRFREWSGCETEEQAAQHIRETCLIESRAEIANNEGAYRDFIDMETRFKIDTGLLPSPR
jgi:hypothetical protein